MWTPDGPGMATKASSRDKGSVSVSVPVINNMFSLCLTMTITSRCLAHFSHAKIRFQSFFMLITNQLFDLASSYNACVNVPTLVSGSPIAGP